METINNMLGSAALIALALALPASAEQQNNSRNKEYAGIQPVAARSIKPARTVETPLQPEASAATSASKNEDEVNPDNMPYITYEGAENTKH